MKTVILDNIYRNGNLVTTMFRNGSLIYQRITKEPEPGPGPVVDYSKMYLTIEALEDGDITLGKPLFYSINDGAWIDSDGERTFHLNSGDVARFKYTDTEIGCSNAFANNGIHFIAYGNIESLEYGDDFISMQTYTTQQNFSYLFSNCSGLTDVSNIVLPATTLANSCYASMFYGSTSFTTAPELPATTLVNNCYEDMFRNCNSLNYVKCLATSLTANFPLYFWVAGVSPTGTFVKKAGVTWPTGNNGIPSGWTVIEE